ncbi:ECF transporter S component [Caldanaerobacter sp.]|uniref:ECF transporter S component n=1 Tax=Caldanaerobacter sp. TaxID=2930036 RepID=UPI003C76ECD8
MKEKEVSLKNVKTLTLVAMLIALSAVGALIKVFNTVAFDSMPGYFAALYLGSFYGAIVIALGHLLTAVTSGFPLGILNHFYIALQMALWAYLFRVFYNMFNVYVAVVLTTLLNGPVATLLFVPMFGWGFFVTWVIPLTVASFINISLAALIYKILSKKGNES